MLCRNLCVELLPELGGKISGGLDLGVARRESARDVGQQGHRGDAEHDDPDIPTAPDAQPIGPYERAHQTPSVSCRKTDSRDARLTTSSAG